jgi:hypothetical protein
MSGNGFSGKDGTVFIGAAGASTQPTKILEVTKWTLDPTVSVSKYNANTTFGHKKAVAGVRDTKGTIEVKIDADDGTQLGPGQEVSLLLQLDDTPANSFTIKRAVIAGGPLEVDIDNGEVVGVTYAFEASDCTGTGLLSSYGTAGVGT